MAVTEKFSFGYLYGYVRLPRQKRGMKKMENVNDFEIVIKRYNSRVEAEEGVNNFIDSCNVAGDVIEDIETHITPTETPRYLSYVFIFKVVRDPKGKAIKRTEERLKKEWQSDYY